MLSRGHYGDLSAASFQITSVWFESGRRLGYSSSPVMSDSEDAVIRPLENAGVIGSSGELCTRAWLVVVKLAHNHFTVQKL